MANGRSVAGSLLLGALVAALTVHPAVAGHEPPRLVLEPIGFGEAGYFDLALEPGESAALEVRASNAGHDAVEAAAYAADAYTIVNGGFGAELRDEEPSGATLWVDFPLTTEELSPGEAITLAFTVSVPPATPPGEYVVAVVAENTEPYRGGGEGVALDQVNRVALALAVDVPGPHLPKLEIGGVDHAVVAERSVVGVGVGNPGNVHLRPQGTLRLFGPAGTRVHDASVVMDSVYAGTATRLEVGLATLLEPGTYCAELTMADEATGVEAHTDCLSFEVPAPASLVPAPGPSEGGVFPMPGAPGGSAAAIVPLIVAVGVLALGLLAWRRQRRREPAAGR